MRNIFGTKPQSIIDAEANAEASKLLIESAIATKKLVENNLIKDQAEQFEASNPRQEQIGLNTEDTTEVINKLVNGVSTNNSEMLLLKQRADELRRWRI